MPDFDGQAIEDAPALAMSNGNDSISATQIPTVMKDALTELSLHAPAAVADEEAQMPLRPSSFEQLVGPTPYLSTVAFEEIVSDCPKSVVEKRDRRHRDQPSTKVGMKNPAALVSLSPVMEETERETSMPSPKSIRPNEYNLDTEYNCRSSISGAIAAQEATFPVERRRLLSIAQVEHINPLPSIPSRRITVANKAAKPTFGKPTMGTLPTYSMPLPVNERPQNQNKGTTRATEASRDGLGPSSAPYNRPNSASISDLHQPYGKNRSVSLASDNTRSRRSIASHPTESKPYDRPASCSTSRVEPQRVRPIVDATSCSKDIYVTMKSQPQETFQMSRPHAGSRSRTVSLPLQISSAASQPRQLTRKTSVDDMFSRKQRISSEGKRADLVTASDRATSVPDEKRRDLTTVTLVEPPNLSSGRIPSTLQAKPGEGILTIPRSFDFARSRKTREKRKREEASKAAPEQPRDRMSVQIEVPTQPVRFCQVQVAIMADCFRGGRQDRPAVSFRDFAMRCQADTEAQEDEIILPLTLEALNAQDELNESRYEAEGMRRNKTASAGNDQVMQSETLQKYLQQLGDPDTQLPADRYVLHLPNQSML